MKSNFKIFILLIIFSSCSAVKNISKDESLKSEPNFFEIVKVKEAYFSETLKNTPDSLKYEEGSELVEYERWYNKWRSRVTSNGSFKPYFEAQSSHFNASNVINANRSFTHDWWEIGPRHTVSGVVGGGLSGVGPMEFVRIYPNSPNTMITGSSVGGLFVTYNGGNSWTNMNSDTMWMNSGCNYATFHPTNSQIVIASANNVVLETGNVATPMNYSGSLVITKNGGASWHKIADYNNLNPKGKLQRFEINPLDPDELFIAASKNLYKSSNILSIAPTFTDISAVNMFTDFSDIEYRPNHLNELFVTAKEKNSGNWNLLHSIDNGNTWKAKPLINSSTYTNLTIETTNTNDELLYLYLSGNLVNQLLKYNSNTQILTQQSSTSNSGGNYGGGYTFAVSDLLTNTGNNIIARNMNIYGEISYDNGVNWSTIPNNIGNGYHVDLEHCAFNPINGNLLISTHGGIYEYNLNTNNIEEKNSGLGTLMISGFDSLHSDPSVLVISMDHNGSAITTNSIYDPNWSPSFRNIYGGDGLKPLVDDNFIMAANQYGSGISNNMGNSFSTINLGLANHGITQAEFVKRPIFSSQDKDIIFLQGQKSSNGTGRQNEVLRSFQKGKSNTWELISDIRGLYSNQPSTMQFFLEKLISAPSNDNVLYAVLVARDQTSWTGFSAVVRTLNAKEKDPNLVSWSIVNIPSVNVNDEPMIKDLEIDYFNPDIIYIAFDNNFYPRSNNLNLGLVYKFDVANSTITNWDPNRSLKDKSVSRDGLVIERGTNGGMYLDTDFGVYYRSNTTANWVKYGNKLPHVRSIDLIIDYATNKLRLGTVGRGLWQINLNCPNDYDLTESGIYNSNEFKEVINNIISTSVITQNRSINYRAGNEIRMKSGFSINAGASFRAVILPCND